MIIPFLLQKIHQIVGGQSDRIVTNLVVKFQNLLFGRGGNVVGKQTPSVDNKLSFSISFFEDVHVAFQCGHSPDGGVEAPDGFLVGNQVVLGVSGEGDADFLEFGGGKGHGPVGSDKEFFVVHGGERAGGQAQEAD